MKVYKILMASLLVSAMSAPVWADDMGDQGSQPEMGNDKAAAPTGEGAPNDNKPATNGAGRAPRKGKQKVKNHSRSNQKHGEEPSH